MEAFEHEPSAAVVVKPMMAARCVCHPGVVGVGETVELAEMDLERRIADDYEAATVRALRDINTGYRPDMANTSGVLRSELTSLRGAHTGKE